jgi:CTP synthase
VRRKLALFCNVALDSVFESLDARTIYEVPMLLRDQAMDQVVLRKLGLSSERQPELAKWESFVHKLLHPEREVRIGLIGKYVELKDSYKSINEALIHAGTEHSAKVDIQWIHSEELTPENAASHLIGLHGVLVAPGFGARGFEGKIEAVRIAREHGIPFFGICFGMQAAVIEYARNVLGHQSANSTEVDPNTPHPVIALMEEQKDVTEKGGTMRLGSCDCLLSPDSKLHKLYGTILVSERHRHRYEFNNAYREQLSEAGLEPVGINPQNDLVEIVTISSHPWFIGVQFHPEYRSTVEAPHPLFTSFVEAALKQSQS